MPDGNSHFVTENCRLWDAMKGVDRKYTKPITGKSYKGDSPNPTYIIMKLTAQLGPIGKGWGFKVKFDRTRYGKPHQVPVEQTTVMRDDLDAEGNQRAKSKTTRWEIIREENHEVCVTFWFRHDDGSETEFDCYGGTPMLYLTKNGHWMFDEDAAKKSLTDAYTKGASWLGACADIFLGLFDDKYSSQPHNPEGNGGQQNGDSGAEPPQGGDPDPSGANDPMNPDNPPQGQQQQQQQQQNRPSGQRQSTEPDW